MIIRTIFRRLLNIIIGEMVGSRVLDPKEIFNQIRKEATFADPSVAAEEIISSAAT